MLLFDRLKKFAARRDGRKLSREREGQAALEVKFQLSRIIC
jgi:hypothetical protein